MIEPFAPPQTVKQALGEQGYIATDEIATVVYLSHVLEKPLLIEGPAGVGKTELAKGVAGATGHELLRLQCYEGLDGTKALHEWEYAKQLLYTQLLRDKLQDVLQDTHTLTAADRLSVEEDVFSPAFPASASAAESHHASGTRGAADRPNRSRRRGVQGISAGDLQ